MTKRIAILCMLSAFALCLSACGDKTEMIISPNENQTAASVSEYLKTPSETEKSDQNAAFVEDIIETTQEDKTETPSEIPMIGGSDYAFSRKYIDKVYNIYMAAEVVGEEAENEWVNNVFLLKTPEEQEELPPIYQMIRDLNITKEDFIAENNKYVDYPDMYFSDDIISALYQEDVEEMKRLLASPLALYYDGEVYTFDELSQSQNARMATNIPADVMSEYLGYIEMVCDENGVLKYMQEDIDSVKMTYQMYQEQENDNTNKVTEQNITDTTANKIETKSSSELTLNSSDYVLNANFTPIYDDVQFMDVPATGGVSSYEELQEYMTAYEDISFVEYEIISQYSPEEAFAKTGDKIFKHSTTLYQAHIYYDYLHDTPVDMIVDLAKAGMPDQQVENNPPYAIGQKIISALSGFNSTSCVAIPELVYYVYDVNGIDLAYHVGNDNVSVQSAAFANLDMDLIGGESSVMTTTVNNPVKFTQKSTVDDLTQFIKQDWEMRGYDFFDVPNFEYNAQTKYNSNEDEMVVE